MSKMTPEQIDEMKGRAQMALDKYKEDVAINCTYAYQIMRYAKLGLYEVKK